MWDHLWTNAAIATMEPGGAPFGLIERGAVAAQDGGIAWIGPMEALPDAASRVVTDCAGLVITPGLIDPHTHIVHAGNRRTDWELRLAGATRDDLARIQGGIRGTMLTTRAASDADLIQQSATRVSRLIANGVTTLESKSGYGLDLETELRLLRISRTLGQRMPVGIVCTFMGAHAVPPEYEGQPDAYIDHLCDTVLPQAVAEGLVDIVDAYCDTANASPCTPTSIPRPPPANAPPAIAPCPRPIWNTRPRQGSRPWPRPEPWPCCCPAPTTRCSR
jgi:imidazolonepropionase